MEVSFSSSREYRFKVDAEGPKPKETSSLGAGKSEYHDGFSKYSKETRTKCLDFRGSDTQMAMAVRKKNL